MRPWPRNDAKDYGMAEYRESTSATAERSAEIFEAIHEKPLHYWTGELVRIGDIVDIENPHWGAPHLELSHGIVLGGKRGGRGELQVLPIESEPLDSGSQIVNPWRQPELKGRFWGCLWDNRFGKENQKPASICSIRVRDPERIGLQYCDKIGHIPGLGLGGDEAFL